jgi:hypothetical protein
LEQNPDEGPFDEFITSKFHFVDLAGNKNNLKKKKKLST